jgi:SAM-dependent methyltransferase
VAEIARVLRPRGALVLMWNRPAGPIEPPIPAVEQLLEPYWPKDIELPLDLNPNRLPHAREWPHAFERSVLEPLQESRFANPQAVDPDGLVAFFGSMGWIGALADDERLTLLGEVRSQLTACGYGCHLRRTSTGRDSPRVTSHPDARPPNPGYATGVSESAAAGR